MLLVGQVRILLYKSNKPWTNKISGKWFWIGIAAVISIAICVVLKINIIQDLLPDLTKIGALKMEGIVGYVASGLAISLSSNLGAWAAERPLKKINTDLKEGTPVPGSEEALQVSVPDEHWSTPVKGYEPVIEPVVEEPIVTTYKTEFLTLWKSKDRPQFIMIERSDGVKTMLKVSDDEYEMELKEAWSKISNLDV